MQGLSFSVAQNTTVGTRPLYGICLPSLAKVLKSFLQSYSKRDAPKQQQALGTRLGGGFPALAFTANPVWDFPLSASQSPTNDRVTSALSQTMGLGFGFF